MPVRAVSAAGSVPVRCRFDRVKCRITGLGDGRTRTECGAPTQVRRVGQAPDGPGIGGVHGVGRPPLVHFLVAASGAIHDEVFPLHQAAPAAAAGRGPASPRRRALRAGRTAVRSTAPAPGPHARSHTRGVAPTAGGSAAAARRHAGRGWRWPIGWPPPRSSSVATTHRSLTPSRTRSVSGR